MNSIFNWQKRVMAMVLTLSMMLSSVTGYVPGWFAAFAEDAALEIGEPVESMQALSDMENASMPANKPDAPLVSDDPALDIESTDVEPLVKEQDVFQLGDEELEISDMPTPPFEQSVSVDGITFTLTAEAGTFPEEAFLRVSAVNDTDVTQTVESIVGDTYVHHLYRVAVVSAEDTTIAPEYAQGMPVVRVSGLDAADTTRVAMVAQGDVYDIDVSVSDGEVVFDYVGALIYDILTVAENGEATEQTGDRFAAVATERPTEDETEEHGEQYTEGATEGSVEPSDEDETEESTEQTAEGEMGEDPDEAPMDEITDDDAAADVQAVSVLFDIMPKNAVVTVYPAATEEAPEPEAIPAQADGSFLLLPGEYTYSVEAEGYWPIEGEPFTVAATGECLTFIFEMAEMLDPEVEEADAPEVHLGLDDSWSDLQDAIDAAEDGDTIMLEGDLCAEDEEASALVIPEGKAITLDLNGCALSRDLPEPVEDGCVIIVYGDLTLIDEAEGGVVTGGKNSGDGGGIYVAAGGSLTLDGAVIEGNFTSGNGGGVCAAGAFTMESGEIDGNEAVSMGGGVYFEDAFAMNGGSLRDNIPEDVCLDRPMALSGRVTIDNAYLPVSDAEYRFFVDGALDGADIQLNVPENAVGGDGLRVTQGLNGQGALTNFRMGKSGNCDVALDDAGEVAIRKYVKITFYKGDGTTASKQESVLGGTEYTLPAWNALFAETADKQFTAWLVKMPDDSEVLKLPGDQLTVTDSISATAQWSLEWSDLQAMINKAGWSDTIKLTGSLSRRAGDEKAYLTIPSGKKITLDLSGCILDGTGVGDRAVIYVEGYLTLTDSVGGGRITGGSAGGVVVNSGSFTLHSGEISGNISKDLGGGVVVNGGSFIMEGEGGSVKGNTAQTGGGVGVSGGSFEMKRGYVSGNTASCGGGVALSGGSFTLTGGRIGDNQATNAAGGVDVLTKATFRMDGGTIQDNKAKEVGGGLRLEKGALVELTGGEISKNSTDGQGGGIYADQADFSIKGVSVTGNEAALGGGIATNGGTFTLTGSSVSYNTASSQGGGLYSSRGTLKLSGGSVIGNDADYGGGAFIAAGTLTMPKNIITANTAKVGGAGVAFSNMQPRLPAIACVRNNNIGDSESNYWLQDGAAFNVTAQLASGFKIYVSAEMKDGASQVIATGEKLSRDNFISTDAKYVSSRNMNGDMLLGVPIPVHFSAGAGTGTMADDTAVMNGAFTLPTARGFTALSDLELQGWRIVKEGYWNTRETKAVGANLPLNDSEMLDDGALYLEAQWGKGTLYVDENGTTRTVGLVKPLSDYQNQGRVTLETGWYLADGATFNDRVVVKGDVNIIIDNAHTTEMNAGILVSSGNQLSVWGQGGWETGSGKLKAVGGKTSCAGIGGVTHQVSGSFALHSGRVEATGGANAAGIGGGDGAYGGTVVIHGGVLIAQGGTSAAGIGGGMSASQGGMVSIYGGTVYAYGGDDGAGIGGGKYSGTVLGNLYGGNGAQVVISGGTVCAQGGRNGAGIGGGYGGRGGSVSINAGSSVIAIAGKNTYDDRTRYQPQAIGRGYYVSAASNYDGSVTLNGRCYVYAGENESSAVSYDSGKEDACKKSFVKINSAENPPSVFTINAKDVDAEKVDIAIYKANDLNKSVNEAAYRDGMAVKIAPAGENKANNHYDGVEITYTYHGETLTLNDYKVEMNGEEALVTFDMPRGDVYVTPKIRTDSFKIRISVAEGRGSAYASMDDETIVEAAVGQNVQIICTPGGATWFLDVQQENTQDMSTYRPYVTYQENGETTVLVTPAVDGNRNVRTFKMPAADVTVSLTFREGVYYCDKDGRHFKEYYHTLTGSETEIKADGKEGSWFYADRSMTFSSRVTLSSEVNLILGPSVTLTFNKGLNVPYSKGGKLKLYEEVKDGGSHLKCDASGEENCAGIGGNNGEQGGTVYIYGGKVTAKGGSNAAGIGGGNHGGLYEYYQYGGTVTAEGGKYGAGVGGGEGYDGSEEEGIKDSVHIYGGTLTANGGSYAAGIGGGQSMHQGKAVYIHDGTVYATGGRDGAGIGGGEEFDPRTSRQVGGNGGDVYVYGGYVKAEGGGGDGGAGIGGGQNGKGGHFTMTGGEVRATGHDNAAGIGGHKNSGGDADISGGKLYAYGGDDAAGIGGGDDHGFGKINISGGTVHAEGGDYGAGIGTGCWGKGGKINITGGIVTAIGGEDAAGVGGGSGNWLHGGGCPDTIAVIGCNLYAYGDECAVGGGQSYTGKFTLSLGTNGSVYVGDSRGGSTTYVSEDRHEAMWDHKYAEFIWCSSHTLGKTVYSYEYIDKDKHHVVGLCEKCKGIVEQDVSHDWRSGGYEVVDSERHQHRLKCVCGANKVRLVEKHFYMNSGRTCTECGYEHANLTVTLLPGDLKGVEPVVLKVEYNTEFNFPKCPWEEDEDHIFRGWGVPNMPIIYGWSNSIHLMEDMTLTATYEHIHEGIRFYPWNQPDKLPAYTTDNQYYYLTCDVTLENGWDPNSVDALCLHGHTLTVKHGDALVDPHTFTIFDEEGGRVVSLDGYAATVYGPFGDFIIKGGTLTGASGGVHVTGWDNGDMRNHTYDSKTDTMYWYKGIITLDGGSIEGCGGYGVTVNSGGRFNLSNGSITGNKGGVCMSDKSFYGRYYEGTTTLFNMTGGTITGNSTSDKGGGVRVTDNCTFVMTGGTITDNSASGGGGGVYVSKGGTFSISEKPMVYGNTNNGAANNVHLNDGARISIDDRLPKDMVMRVSVYPEPTEGAPTIITQGLSGKGFASRFKPDNEGFAIKTVEGEAAIGKFPPSVVRFDANGGTGSMADDTWPEDSDYTLPECAFTPPGHLTFAGWSVNGNAEPQTPGAVIDASDNDNLNVKAIWKDIHDGLVFEPWTSGNSLPEESGNYYLTRDVYVTDQWTIDKDDCINVCLNGHRVQIYDIHYYAGIRLDNNATLNFYDPTGEGSVEDLENGKPIEAYSSCALGLYGGMLKGNLDFGGRTFELVGGDVTGGISAKGTMNMKGGTVGGGITVNGTLNMTGGTITGGGITAKGKLNMTGGTITGSKDGGLRVASGATVSLTGGSITDNTRDGKPCNIYLEDGARLAMDAVTPESDVLYSFTTAVEPTKFASVVLTTGLGGRDLLDRFIPEDDNYMVAINNSGEAELREKFEGDPEGVPIFRTHSLLLTGEIGVNFFMELPEGLNYSGAYMEFTVQSKNGQTMRDHLDLNDRDVNGKGYYGFTVNINAIQMAAPIHAVFHYGDGETVEQTYCVKDYVAAYEKVADSFDATTTALVHAIADYGHYAQIALSKANGWSIGEDYAEMDLYYRKSIDYDEVTRAVSGFAKKYEYYNGTKLKQISIALNLLSATRMRLIFDFTDNYAHRPVGFYVNYEYMPEEQLYERGVYRYRLDLGNIPAHELDKEFYIIISRRGNDSDAIVYPLSYVYSALTTNTDDSLKDCTSALYYYYKAVKDYRAAHGY